MAEKKGMGWLTLIVGVLVVVFAWVGGTTAQWVETVLGVIAVIVGIMLLK